MLLAWLRKLARVHLVFVVLMAAALYGPRDVRQIGDRIQIALPTLAWGCAVLNGQGAEYALRFTAMMLVAHGSKHALGQAPINIRPDGGDLGFPSAHTSASALGASSLAHDCLSASPVGKAIVVLAAGFVGGSRIESSRHDIWQVLAGAILGWGSDRILRRDSRARRAVGRAVASLGRVFITRCQAVIGRIPAILRRIGAP